MSDMCSCNRSRNYDALLERYKKLEQVALQLYYRLWGRIVLNLNDMRFDKKAAAADDLLKYEREQLEALGVNIDD